MLLMAGIENREFNHEEHFKFLQHTKEVSLKLDESGKIPKSWILLDNQSTVDVFYNANLLRNIRKGEKHMDIHLTQVLQALTWLVTCQDMGQCGTIQMGLPTSCPWQKCRNVGTTLNMTARMEMNSPFTNPMEA